MNKIGSQSDLIRGIINPAVIYAISVVNPVPVTNRIEMQTLRFATTRCSRVSAPRRIVAHSSAQSSAPGQKRVIDTGFILKLVASTTVEVSYARLGSTH